MISRRVFIPPEKVPSAPPCSAEAHHWMLGNGASNVAGRCKRCGVERVFLGARDMEQVEMTVSRYEALGTAWSA